MKTKITCIVIILTKTLLCQNSYLADRIFIKFQRGVNFEIYYENRGDNIYALTGINEIDEMNYRYNCSDIKPLFVGSDEVLRRWYIFFLTDANVWLAKQQYETLLEYIEYVDLAGIYNVGYEPNDPLFNPVNHKALREKS